MARLLPALLLLALSLGPLLRWQERRSLLARAAPAAAEAEAPPAPAAATPAWREPLGRRPGALPSPEEIQTDLARLWGLEDRQDPENLLAAGGPAGEALRLELARWLELGPGERDRIEALTLEPGTGGGLRLRLRLLGTAESTGVWASHLLGMPAGRGYLVDPLRLSWKPAGSSWRLEVEVRVLPVEALESGGGP